MLKNLSAFGILFAILFFFGGCTVDKFEGEFDIDAEIMHMGSSVVSVKYKLGVSEIHDDILMKEKVSILSEWKHQNLQVIPLKVTIYGFSDSEGKTVSEVKYYYKSILIYTNEDWDFDSIKMLASDNFDMFNWEYKDGDCVSKETEEKAEPKQKTGKVGAGKGDKL